MRYHAWSPLSDRRVTCPGGHTFSPDAMLREGRAEITCKWKTGEAQQCGARMVLVAFPAAGYKLVLACTSAEFDAATAKMGDAALLWLATQPAA